MPLLLTAFVYSFAALTAAPPPPAGLAVAARPPAAQGAAQKKPHPKIEEGVECLGCHKGLAERAVVHAPVAAGVCTECHVAAAGRSGVGLAKGATKDHTAPLCVGCHEDVGARLKMAAVHAPAAGGDCIGCHDPHGSNSPRMLPAPASAFCLTCHDSVAEALKQSTPHAPAAAQCSLCHDPHGSPHPRQLRDGGNALCQSCHVTAPPADDKPGELGGRALADGERKLMSGARRISLDALGRSGHPNFGHPVAGMANPADKDRSPMGCVSCHQPHGAGTPLLLQFRAAGPTELCLKCHK